MAEIEESKRVRDTRFVRVREWLYVCHRARSKSFCVLSCRIVLHVQGRLGLQLDGNGQQAVNQCWRQDVRVGPDGGIQDAAWVFDRGGIALRRNSQCGERSRDSTVDADCFAGREEMVKKRGGRGHAEGVRLRLGEKRTKRAASGEG